MKNDTSDNQVSNETVVWWLSIGVVSGFVIAAVMMAG